MSDFTPLSYAQVYNAGMERIREVGATANLDLGSETQAVNRLGREYLDRITFEMKMMDSAFADTRTTVFGHDVPYPIQVAAAHEGRLLKAVAQHWEESPLEKMAEAAASQGTWMWVGESLPENLQRILKIGAKVVKIVKPVSNPGYDENPNVVSTLKDAEQRGCVAVGMDIDVFYGEKTQDEPPYRYALGPKSLDEMRSFVEATSLPFIAKGVLSVSDAIKCQEVGAQGIVISHHGGEAIDYAVPILRVLPHIRDACPDLTIFVDSGFRRGSDALKALALGADVVCVLTILMIAYAGYGRRGVENMLIALAHELQRNMSICGAKSIAEIDRDILWLPYPDRNRGE